MQPNEIKYNSIDMPLGVFMNALCDGDMSQVDDFDKVYNEFQEAMGGKELIEELENMKDDTKLRISVALAVEIISKLEEDPDPELFEQLKKLNFHMRVPGADLEDMEKYCKQIEGWIKYDIVQIKENEAESKTKETNTGAFTYTRDYFADMLLEITAVLNTPMNESMSVRMFCRAVVRLKAHRDYLLRKQTKKAA